MRDFSALYVRFSNRPSGLSTFRLSATPVSMSLTGSRLQDIESVRGGRQNRVAKQAEWAIPSRREDEGCDCGAAEIQLIAENAPRWPDVNT